MHFTARENSRAKGLHLSGSLLDKHRFLLFCFLIGTSIERQHCNNGVNNSCKRNCIEARCTQICNNDNYKCNLVCNRNDCTQICNSNTCHLDCKGTTCNQTCNANVKFCYMKCNSSKCVQICNAKNCDLVIIRFEQAKLASQTCNDGKGTCCQTCNDQWCKHNCNRRECIYPCQNKFDRSKCVQSGIALPINITETEGNVFLATNIKWYGKKSAILILKLANQRWLFQVMLFRYF